jgi:NRPS condensation-like uncharacterized protein
MMPVSPLDAMQYRFRHDGSYMIHFVVKTRGRFDPVKLEQSLCRVALQVPVLSSRYMCEDGVPKVWERLPELPSLVTVSAESSDTVVRTPYDLEGKPPVRAVVCRGTYADDLVVSADHVAMDARGVFVLMELLSAAYRGEEVPAKEQPCDRGFESLLRQFTGGELKESVRKAEEPVNGLFPWKTPFEDRLTENPENTVIRRCFPDVDALKQFARRYDGTVNDVLISAFALVLHELGAKGVIPIESVIDMRRYFPADGWMVNLSVAYWSPVSPSGALGETVQAVARRSAEMKKDNPGLGNAVSFMDPAKRERLGIRLMGDDPDLTVRSPFISNVGVIPEACVAFGDEIPVEDVYIFANFVSEEYPSVVACTWDDTLNLLSTGARGAKLVETVIERMIGIMEGAVLS